MVEPTNVKPRRLRSLLTRSESSVVAGRSARDRGRLTIVAPSTQPAGTVVYQNPAAGVDAYQTSTITITVSSA